MPNILRPLSEPFPDSIASALAAYPQQDGYILGLFRVFANSLRFLSGKGVTNLLDEASPIAMRLREIIILRVCANNQCGYEWGVHAALFSHHARLSQAQLNNTAAAEINPQFWNDEEALLLSVVDELSQSGRLKQGTLQRFRSTWQVDQQLEILALCGNYHTISFVANLSDLPPEPFSAPYPS